MPNNQVVLEAAARAAILRAAEAADWTQVAEHGSAPCFCMSGGRFCFRGEDWPGHQGPRKLHSFMPLTVLLEALSLAAARRQ